INEPEPVRLWGWINDLLVRAGLPRVSRRISAGAAWHLGAACEGVCGLLRCRQDPPMTRFLAAQLSQSHSYRIDRARRDFDFTPLVTVDEGMRRIEPELRRLATA